MNNISIKSFKDLQVWQKSADLAVLIYKSLTTKSYILNSRKGFSLLELLIYISLISIISLVLAQLFVSISRGGASAEAQSEVNSNLRFAVDKIAQDVRSASSVSVPASAGASGSTLTLSVSGSNVAYCVVGGALRRESSGGACGASSPAITADSVVADSVLFTRLENTNTVSSKTIITIEINLTMSYNSSVPEYQHSTTKKATVALRR